MSTPTRADTVRADEGFDAAFSGLLPRLYRRASQLAGGTSQSAEDAVHDTYLKLAARPRAFLDHPEPYAYAFRALLSVIRDRGRRDRRMVPTAEVGAPGAAWDGGVERRTAELDVLWLLTELTPRQAGSVILVDIDGHTLDQAARILGVHRGTVARSRARALERLRQRIRAQGQGDLTQQGKPGNIMNPAEPAARSTSASPAGTGTAAAGVRPGPAGHRTVRTGRPGPRARCGGAADG